jgi:integrase
MLTDANCRNATCPPTLKRKRLTDGGGLYLEVSPAGSKRWFWKFYPDGKESRLALGSYPDVGLAAARQKRDEARRTRKGGANPVQQRRAEKLAAKASSATTFEAVAREFHATTRGAWSDSHADQWLRCMEKDVFPRLGALPLADVSAPVLLDALRKVQARGALRAAHDLRQFSGQVFRFGIATGRCSSNPASDLRDGLKPFLERNLAALIEPAAVGALMRGIDDYKGQPATRGALLLSALTFQRPGNVRAMEWAEVDRAAALWSIPAAKMKRTLHGKVNGDAHLVPLSPQALAVLDELRPLTGHGRFVFPSLLTGERCMSENTVRNALRRLGYGNSDMTAHGFRAMARTMADEQLGIDPKVIEAQLAHGKSGPLGMAYDRAEFMAQRRHLMTAWADYLDRLREGAKVVPLNPKLAA